MKWLAMFKRRNKQDKVDTSQAKYLPDSLLLEERINMNLALVSILTIACLVLILLIWASLTHIEEAAITQGEVAPKEKVTIAQHLEGGIVKRLYVQNGDPVKKNQILVEFDQKASLAELETMQAKEFSLLFEVKRLRSYLAENFGDFKEDQMFNEIMQLKNVRNSDAINEMIKEETLFLKTQNDGRMAQRKVIEAQLHRQREALKQYRKQEAIAREGVSLSRKEVTISDQMAAEQLVSETEHLKVLRDANHSQGELEKIIGQERQTQKELVETELKLHELDYGLREVAFQNLVQLTGELLQTQKSIAKLEDRVNRLNVRAPVDGRVKGLEITAGSVVTPGGAMMEIVPDSSELIVETRIEPKDIGHMYLGESVKIKVTTYDYSRYGAIKGKLVNISATTFKTENEEPYYIGEVELEKQYLGSSQDPKILMPGMSVQADIITGDKTLLQYLLKPIHKAMSSAFAER